MAKTISGTKKKDGSSLSSTMIQPIGDILRRRKIFWTDGSKHQLPELHFVIDVNMIHRILEQNISYCVRPTHIVHLVASSRPIDDIIHWKKRHDAINKIMRLKLPFWKQLRKVEVRSKAASFFICFLHSSSITSSQETLQSF